MQAILYVLYAIILAAVVNGLIGTTSRDWAFAARKEVNAAAMSK